VKNFLDPFSDPAGTSGHPQPNAALEHNGERYDRDNQKSATLPDRPFVKLVDQPVTS